MYNISVPVISGKVDRCGREKILNELKRFDAKRVFSALGVYNLDPVDRAEEMRALKENCDYFKKHGFEVSAWKWTFWMNEGHDFVHLKGMDGEDKPLFVCPADENFVKYVQEYFKDLARCGVDMILSDDDFTYGLGKSPACMCDLHLAEINRITGEQKDREELAKLIMTGGKNKYRDAYLKANGDFLRNFVIKVREAIDEVNPNVRWGRCVCFGSWDVDGVDVAEIAKLMAGNTKPFVRLIGAPYWAVKELYSGCKLQDVVEIERMESSWLAGEDIEVVAEGDPFPRPRFTCPASYLEGFDTAMRVAGCTDGIMKYGIDYYSNAGYESGYANFHERNRKTYEQIDEMFGNKKSCGVRVYETMHKISQLQFSTKINDKTDFIDIFFPRSSRTLACNSVPTVYEGSGVCGIVFDENARAIPLDSMKNGLIIDIQAAEILMERGVDVGIDSFGDNCVTNGEEHFLSDDNYINSGSLHYNDIKLKNKAKILSELCLKKGNVPLSYLYENEEGNKFLVLNINTRNSADNILRHYARSRQYAEAVEWISGKKLPAYTYGHPSMYMQCKEGDNSLAVGMWNFFADVAINPVIELAESYSDIRFIKCNGTLDGDKVYLDDIPAFGFAAFEVIK